MYKSGQQIHQAPTFHVVAKDNSKENNRALTS
jgi:hypothetical protein